MWENKERIQANIGVYMNAIGRLMEYLDRENARPIAIASAPGRVDFLNTHQDYKGLPVVPIAVDLRIYMAAIRMDEEKFIVESLDLGSRGEFYPSSKPRGEGFVRYLEACMVALEKTTGIHVGGGYRIIISSDIPIGGGMGSSGALEVCFLKLITHISNIRVDTQTLAETAFIAENRILGIPCGRLDQYASAFGGVIMLIPKYPPKIERLGEPPLEILVIDSGIKHRTEAIHPIRQEEIMRGIKEILAMDIPDGLRRKLSGKIDDIKWSEITEEELKPYIERIDWTSAKRILFTIRMNTLTEIAVRMLKGEKLTARDKEYLKIMGIDTGEEKEILPSIINKQHELLRDLYDVSTPEIEEIIRSALSAGAKAAKISGAGLGGCIIAFTEKKKIGNVSKACMDAGARRVWHVHIDVGAKIEPTHSTST